MSHGPNHLNETKTQQALLAPLPEWMTSALQSRSWRALGDLRFPEIARAASSGDHGKDHGDAAQRSESETQTWPYQEQNPVLPEVQEAEGLQPKAQLGRSVERTPSGRT